MRCRGDGGTTLVIALRFPTHGTGRRHEEDEDSPLRGILLPLWASTGEGLLLAVIFTNRFLGMGSRGYRSAPQLIYTNWAVYAVFVTCGCPNDHPGLRRARAGASGA